MAVELRPLGRGGAPDRSVTPLLQRTLPAAPDPLGFVESAAPPALSLLVPGGTAEDATVQTNLRQLRNACGGTVATAELARTFGLEDLLRSDWPERLPVRCP